MIIIFIQVISKRTTIVKKRDDTNFIPIIKHIVVLLSISNSESCKVHKSCNIGKEKETLPFS